MNPSVVPVVRFQPIDANSAFAAHAALVKAEATQPELRNNEHWRALRDTAFARFRAAFEITPSGE